uniref:PAM2 domain-containing protein n=1 Tax=Globodera pallida TaxID=36090 RepID=A0A183C921_GLOPA
MTSSEESNEQLVQEIVGNVLSDTVKDEQQQEELQLLEDEEKLNAAGTVEVVDVGHHSFVQPADESNDYSMESVKEEQDTDESVQRIADKVEGISLKENIKEEDANTTPTEQDDKVSVNSNENKEELQLLEDEGKLNDVGTVDVVDVGHHSFVPADESNDCSMGSVKEEQDTDESVQRIADKVEGILLKENIKEEEANTPPTEQDDKISVNSNENKDALSSPPREVPSVVAVVTPLSANAQQQEDHQQHSEQIGSAAQNAETNRESAGDDTDALSSPPREVPPSTSAKDGVVGKGRPGCSAGTATKTEAKAKTKACSVL